MLNLVPFEQTRAYQDAKQEGRQEGLYQVARRLLEANFPPEQVAQLTNLTCAEIQQLQNESPQLPN
jgi:predicted transposase YdaD